MPGSRPRPLGRPGAAFSGSNRPDGWAGYLASRDMGVPAPRPRRHGNWRHGGRSAAGIAASREVRACIRALRGRLAYLPASVATERSSGWRCFRRDVDGGER